MPPYLFIDPVRQRQCLDRAEASVCRLTARETAEELLSTAELVVAEGGVFPLQKYLSLPSRHAKELLSSAEMAVVSASAAAEEEEGALASQQRLRTPLHHAELRGPQWRRRVLDAVQELVWEGQRRQGQHLHRGVLGSSLYSLLLSWTRKCAGERKQAVGIDDPQRPPSSSAPDDVVREALVLLAAAHLRAARKGGALPEATAATGIVAAAAASRLAACKLSAALKEVDTVAAVRAAAGSPSEAGGSRGKDDDADVERLIDQLAEAQYLLGAAHMALAAHLQGSDKTEQGADKSEQCADKSAHQQTAPDQGMPIPDMAAQYASLESSQDALSLPATGLTGDQLLPWAHRRSLLLLSAIRSLTRASELIPSEAGGPFRAAMLGAMSALGDGEAASKAVREAKRSGPLVVEEAVDCFPLAGADGGGLPSEAVPHAMSGKVEKAEVPLSYCLVTVDGRPHEGPQAGLPKHPFGLSRVFYDAKELPGQQQQAWCMLSDGSCMWRQSASEIQIYAFRVPQDLPARRLSVTLGPRILEVGQ